MSEDMPRAYEGDRDYVFVGYSHDDRDAVLPIIRDLVAKGFRVWYDDGIELAEDYPEYVADHVYRCTCFILFISKGSLASRWCRQEINYALDLDKKVLPIYLEDVELTRGLAMRMGNKQALFWYEFDTDEAFNRKLFKARRLESCLSDEARQRGGVKRRPGQEKGGGFADNGTKATDKGGVAPTGSAQHASQMLRADEPTPERKVVSQTAKEPPVLSKDTRDGAQVAADQRPDTGGQADEGARARFSGRMAQEAAVKPRNTVPGVERKGSLAEYSWAELKQISQAIAAAGSDGDGLAIAKEYRLAGEDGRLRGDTKPLTLKDKDATGASVRILGFRHDDLAGGKGKAGISFEFAGVPTTHSMNANWTNAGGWEKSDMREWLNSDFLALLPDDLRANVAGARKRTNNRSRVPKNDTTAVTGTADRLWLLSMNEVYGNRPGVYGEEGIQYKLYSDKGVSATNYKPCQKRGADSWWWLRSPNAYHSLGFHYVDSDGDWNLDYANHVGGVSPGFCF